MRGDVDKVELCEGWPDELKNASLQVYHDRCKIICLEAELKRIDFFSEDYEKIIQELDKAHADLTKDFLFFTQQKYRHMQEEIKEERF